MDRRAAGALLALAACFACSAAAPTASNQTALDLYEGAPEGCYYNFQHYGEGDRIMTNEPCLNCTCHNRMLMCYLRVCPFTKAIGQDCTVEKRADQCCPIVTCPDVPVDLLTSTSTTSPAEYGATGLGKLDKYGCSINGKYFPEGSKVPPTPNKPCEHCYCIRNMTTCVMQECTLHVDGCTPIYHKDVCCPVRYSCDHPEDEVPLLDDMSTTVRPTPGFLLTTTTMSPVTQMTQDCVHDDQVFSDGALIKTEKACEHCYCMKGDIVCVVQECGAPMENEGKNCTSLPPREGQCCPDTYICEGDELSSDLPTEPTTESIIEKLTTLSPPRRTSVEGSGYRIEPDEASYTEMPILEPEIEGSGDIEETPKPIGSDDILPTPGDDEQYIYVTTKGPAHEEHEKTTEAVDKDMIPDLKDKTDEPHVSTSAPISEEVEKPTTSNVEEISEPHKAVPTTKAPEMYESGTTELGDLQNTVPDVIPDEEIAKPHEYAPSSTYSPTSESQHTEDEDDKLTTSLKEQDVTKSTTLKPEYSTTSSLDETEKETSAPTVISNVTPEVIPEKEYTESDITRTTSAISAEESPVEEDKEITKPDILAASTTASPAEEGKETTKPDLLAPGTTISPAEEDKETYKPDILAASTTTSPAEEEKEIAKPDLLAPGTTISPAEEDKETHKPEILDASSTISPAEEEKETTKPDLLAPDEEEKESDKPDLQASITTISPTDEEKQSLKPEEYAPSTTSKPAEEEKESSIPEHLIPITTSSPLEEEEKFTTEPDHALNTVAVAEEDSKHPYEQIPTTEASHEVKEEGTTVFKQEPEDVTDKIIIEDTPTEHVTTAAPAVEETELTTAEPDRGLNTIPSEIYEETSSEPSLPGRTTIYEETRRTESSPITDEQQTQGVDIKSTSISELTTPLPESVATKGDQLTVTTEPSFRKEDEVIVSSEKPKETEPTTVKSEFVDEGLIPTSSHDDKISTSSDGPITDEEFTTLVPEYGTELTETSEAKQTTTESAKETPAVTEIVPEKVPDHDGAFPSSTEKLSEITPLVEIHEEPSRIPGEGDCLLNGVTYKNNTVVPSTNNCHTGCRCASSIIKCDPIICSSPPDYMDNCQSIYDSPDSCCPTFVCDHPRETVPPQSDNQMSGTESPMPSPTIECRGDQCEISVPTKQPLIPSEPCTAGSCLPESDHKTEAECGSEGCGDVPQKPDTSLPSGEHVEACSDGKCKTETEVSAVTPCEGDNCQKTGETDKPLESPQQCKNGEECKTLEIPSVDATPCEGDSCKKIDCGDGGCGPDVITSPPDNKLESCKEEDGCKPQDIPIPECTGDEPCRRKETSDSDTKPKPPTSCEGPNCISDEKTADEIPSVEVTERIVPTEGITATEISEDHISNENIPVKDAQEMDIHTTEGPTAGSEGVNVDEEKPVIEDDVTKKPTLDEEKGTEVPSTINEGDKIKPTIEKIVTDTPEVVEQETAKPITIDKEAEEKPAAEEEKSTEVPVTVEGEVTKEPTLPGDEDKGAVSEEEGTEAPTLDVREGTENPTIGEEGIEGKPIVEGSTKQPDAVDQEDKEKQHIDKDGTTKPDLVEEEGTTKPIITEEQATTISIIEEKTTDVPTITDQFKTDIPAVSDTDTEKPSLHDEEQKPTDVDEKNTDKPEQKPVVETGSEQPDHEREGTDKPAVEEGVTKTPDVIKQETTVKPIDIDSEFTEKPTHDEEKGTEIPTLATEGGEKELIATEAGTEKPVIIDGELSEKPIVEEKDKIPAVVEKEVTEEPTAVDKDIEKPLVEPDDKTEASAVDQESTEKTVISDVTKSEKSPEIEEDQVTLKPGSDEKSTESTDVDEGTEKPTGVDKDTKKPDFIETESTKEPSDIDKQVTELPASTGEEHTKGPDVIEDEDLTKTVTEEDTMKPFTIKEDSTAIPDFTKEEGTAKPVIFDEGTEEPAIIEKQDPTKTTAIEREGTELPGIIGEEPTAKPDMAGQEETKTPAVVEEGIIKPGDEGTEEPSTFDTESTEKPVISEDKDHKNLETEKPVIIDEEITDKPIDNEVVSSEKPITHEEEGSGTEIPESSLTTESFKEVKSPELTAQPTESTISETEKATKSPYSESQTTLAEPNAAEPIDVSSPETKVTEAEGSSQEPEIHDHSRIPEISTEPLSEQEITTKASVTDNDKKMISEEGVEATTLKLDAIDVKVESSTVGQDLIDEEPALVTKTPELPKTSESVEKMTDSESTSDREEVFTDKSDIEFPTTKAPGTGPSIIEPQDGVETQEPEQHVTNKSEEDSTTKVYEDEKLKPVPELHVTETSSASPEFEPSDGITDVSPTADEHKPKPESPEQHGTQPDEESTQVPVVEIKTDHPEIHSSEKEETITETSEYSVTEPVRRYTEIEEPSVTGQEDLVTGYPEHYVPSGTDKTDISGDDGIPSSEKPLLTDMEMELPEKSTESDKFVTKMPEQDYQTPGKVKPTDEFETPVTEIPISVVTEPQLTSDIPEKDLTKYEEKTTIVPEITDHKHIDTTLPEGHTEQQEPVTATEEQNKATVPNLEEPNFTELPETSTKTVEEEIKDAQAITTAIPRTEEETVTKAPEQIYTESHDLDKTEPSIPEIQKVSTDLPVEEVQTELPGIQMSSEVPQSLVTGQPEILSEETTISSVPKEEISEAPEKQKPGQEETRTEVPIHVTESAEISTVGTKEQEDKMPHAPEETVTEKQGTELPSVAEKIDQIDVMKPTEHTSAQTEFSETTPYLIELEEHTHKIVEDFTTASPSVEEHSYKPVEDTSIPSSSEEEHSYKPVEDISTSSPAEEEHSQTPVDDISTSSPTEDEELHKPVEDISTSSPIVDEYSHKPDEEISTRSPADEEHSYKPVEDISTSSPSEAEHSHKPVEDISTPSPSDEEHSYKPVEDISTSSPSEEEHSHKPVEDISTASPSDEEHSYKPIEDITTSLPSEEEHSQKPVEDITTPSPSDEEHSHKPVEDISTSSPTTDDELRKPLEDITTSSPSEEEHSHKPIEDISTSSPLEEEHSYKPVQDISTLSPSEEDDLHKPVEDISTASPSEEEHSIKPIEDISTSLPPAEKDTSNIEEHISTVSPYEEKPTTVQPFAGEESTTKTDEEIETATKEVEGITKISEVSLPEDVSEKVSESVPVEETTPAIVHGEDDKDHKEYTTSAPTPTSPAVATESEKLPTSESDIATPTEKETSISEKPIVSHETTVPEEEFIFTTTKATTVRQGEDMATSQRPDSDKLATEPEEKPSGASEVHPSSTTTEVSKPSIPDLQPTDEIPVPDDDGHFPPSGTSGYGEPDYVEEDQAFGPGTCRYGGKVYVSAQQIPRDDPCDFCFCFRSDIICLQQSCPPPIHGCHEEPIQGFCCPRYECPVSMATTVNVTTTTTTTTTTLPPHFPTHSYKGAAQRRGCQIKGHTYKVGEVVRSSSGPCLHCTCGGDGQMKCDPKACTPEPMLRQMIAAAVSAKRRR